MKFMIRSGILAALGLFLFSQSPEARQAAADDEAGFKSMFDGKTLEGWDGDPDFWSVQDGVITGQTTKEKPAKYNTFLIWRGGKPGDFEIKAEFCMPDPGFTNSGIQIRSWEGPKKWQVSGYQPDMDWENHYTGICYGENFRGILANRGQKTVIGKDHKPKVLEQFAASEDLAKIIKMHDWNEYDVTAEGNHITEKINGKLMCELTDEDDMARKDGVIALQIHAGPPMKVQFRNLRIKEKRLDPKMKADSASKDVSKKIVFIAGAPSHGYAQHEHFAGCALLAKCIQENVPNVETIVSKGWPTDPKMLEDAATVVIYADGGPGHPLMKHLDEFDALAKKGVGLVCLHYAVEIPKGRPGDLLLSWIGGYFEEFWSVNPEWTGSFTNFPTHPVANGVKPFSTHDEWYFHMRFPKDMNGVTPLLTAIPPDSAHRDINDAHGGNPTVFKRKGMSEHTAWAYQRPDGGRGFGYTGGHHHWNWGCDSTRTLVLNAIVWTAGLEVPAEGVPSKTPTLEELEANQDKPQPKDFDRDAIRKELADFKKASAAN